MQADLTWSWDHQIQTFWPLQQMNYKEEAVPFPQL